jgi:hypothetical protein
MYEFVFSPSETSPIHWISGGKAGLYKFAAFHRLKSTAEKSG